MVVPIGNGKSKTYWVDIDEANRSQMLRAVTQKREQMVGEALRIANGITLIVAVLYVIGKKLEAIHGLLVDRLPKDAENRREP